EEGVSTEPIQHHASSDDPPFPGEPAVPMFVDVSQRLLARDGLLPWVLEQRDLTDGKPPGLLPPPLDDELDDLVLTAGISRRIADGNRDERFYGAATAQPIVANSIDRGRIPATAQLDAGGTDQGQALLGCSAQ